jgi:hypothetical protein
LKKLNNHIDNKISRRQQPSTTKSVPAQSPPPATTFNLPPPPPVINTTIPSFNNEEYSIFRDRPVSGPTTTTVRSYSSKKEFLFVFY